jgi:methionyl-tRNA formyltransferase
MTRAVVFAYHNVGVRCLEVLLNHKVDIPLIVTHRDNPREKIWFDSVAALASARGLPVTMPDDPNAADTVERASGLKPDFLFSFYYRHMLKEPLLLAATRGALNMHGSLLPKYRGRVPVNWAVINGETATGATLHYMTAKPDAGDIVDQQGVPILPDDTAREVFDKVTAAAATVLDRSLPGLIAGTAPRRPQDLAAGSYFGGRSPEDGRIDWSQSAARVHNLVRGVAPPYPGAYTDLDGVALRILRTRVETGRAPQMDPPALYLQDDACFAACADGGALRLLEMEYQGKPFAARDFMARFGRGPLRLQSQRR